MKVAAIIPAAGRGSRLKSKVPKPYVPVHGKPLLVHTLQNLHCSYPFQETVVMVDPSYLKKTRRLLDRHHLQGVRVEAGGLTRADSVRRGVLSLKGDAEWVLVHDAARPLVNRALVHRTLRAAKITGAALCALPVSSTVKRMRPARNVILGTEDRGSLCLAQTPQVFRRDLLLSRYKSLGDKAMEATDEAALFDRGRVSVQVVQGFPRNIKVTTPDDLELLEFYLDRLGPPSRGL